MNGLGKVQDSSMPLGCCLSELDTGLRETGGTGDPGSSALGRDRRAINKKKSYRRHPKPPYSYLALIAMVILNSPEKRRTLSQILQAIGRMPPFSSSDYQGWKDSVRHNLSANDCFVKVLKDPKNPRSKGNGWTVDTSRIPIKALKCQTTSVTRLKEAAFGQDLDLLLLLGDRSRVRGEGGGGDDQRQSIGALLPLPPTPDTSSGFNLSQNPSPSASSVAAPAVSPHSERGSPGPTSSCSSSGSDREPESPRDWAQPPWELPTSHTQYTPPNAVAPPSGGLPRPSIPGLPRYPYWSPVPQSSARVPPNPSPHLYPTLNPGADLEAMLRVVPPNKSVFDAIIPQHLPRYG
ncbi:forkhead box protein H1 [Heterodontus francisci]|uniref:forkhead box protein H1 n=1 Tax=Heterodontus francisci TaxID=7792 RepID=UPI00355B5CDA